MKNIKMIFKFIKQKLQDNINGYFYAIVSNVLRSTIFPYPINV